ncbi:helix-turn-helix domain-containing protein [Nocardia sp. NPDC050193]
MGVKAVKRAYKYRIYPTSEQKEQLARTFGCVRYVYNGALAERSRSWTQEGRRISYAEAGRLAIEDLSVWNMVGNRCLARAISDASWSQLRCMPECTAGRYGRTVVAVDRFHP